MNQVYSLIDEYGVLVGRVLMGLLFAFSGIGILMMGISGTAGMIDAKGLPMAILIAWAIVIIKIAAGGALMFGYRTRDAAFALVVFTALATVFYHMNLQDINLFKNLAIIGGLLYVIANTECSTCKAKEDSSPTMAI